MYNQCNYNAGHYKLIESEENVIIHGPQQLNTGTCNIKELVQALGISYTLLAYITFS